MAPEHLDGVDRGILHLLQEDARHLASVDTAKELDVSDGAVRNRIEKPEAAGVIEGYVLTVTYEAAGFPLKIGFSCTAPFADAVTWPGRPSTWVASSTSGR